VEENALVKPIERAKVTDKCELHYSPWETISVNYGEARLWLLDHCPSLTSVLVTDIYSDTKFRILLLYVLDDFPFLKCILYA
jgi:hypothetical protein